MANEIQVTSGLIIKQGTDPIQIDYVSRPTSFRADMTGVLGPTPGAFVATVLGTDVDLSTLTTPGFCRISNQDATNYVTVGLWDPEGTDFFPIFEVWPGESYVMRLARDIQEEYETGTGTTGANTNRLRIKADTASCNVLVEAFEK